MPTANGEWPPADEESGGVMVGATALTDGEQGEVPQPLAGDEFKVLFGDATWKSLILPPLGGADPVLGFGNNNVSSTTTTRYLSCWYSDTLAPTTEVSKMVIPLDSSGGQLRYLYVRHNRANGNGEVVTYTVRKNGADTGLTVDLATGAIGQASELVTAVDVVAGDTVSVSATKLLGIGNGRVEAIVTMQLAGPSEPVPP